MVTSSSHVNVLVFFAPVLTLLQVAAIDYLFPTHEKCKYLAYRPPVPPGFAIFPGKFILHASLSFFNLMSSDLIFHFTTAN